jgi:hypothetical protein
VQTSVISDGCRPGCYDQDVIQPAAHRKPEIPSRTDPAGIRAGLPPENVAEFDEDYQQVMAQAAKTLDLAPVLDALEHWHRIAWMYTVDPAGYRRMLDTASRIIAGEDMPTVPGDVSKAKLAARIVAAR